MRGATHFVVAPFLCQEEKRVPEITEMTDAELVAIPEKTRDSNLATTATLELLRRMKESIDKLTAALQPKV